MKAIIKVLKKCANVLIEFSQRDVLYTPSGVIPIRNNRK